MLFIGVIFIAQPKADAALADQDGRVLYIKEPVSIDGEEEDTATKVVTSDAEGNGAVVAAESDNIIEKATMSGQKESGNYDIVYAETIYNCLPIEQEIAVPCNDINDGNPLPVSSDARLYKVTVDQNGVVINSPTKILDFNPLSKVESECPYNRVTELSFSPDGKYVLVTRSSYDSPNGGSIPCLSTIERVDINNGNLLTVVDPAKDSALNGGYANNGDIYFSKTTADGSDIWVQKNGSSTQQQLTVTSDISEYYLDASPDSKELLVVGLTESCKYSTYYIFDRSEYNSFCNYYFIDSTTGTGTMLVGLAPYFMPIYYSPDGLKLIGTQYPAKRLYRTFSEIDPDTLDYPVTAFVYRSDLSKSYLFSELLFVNEWAPSFRLASSSTSNQSATLAYTGSNSILVLEFALSLMIISGLIGLRFKLSKNS